MFKGCPSIVGGIHLSRLAIYGHDFGYVPQIIGIALNRKQQFFRRIRVDQRDANQGLAVRRIFLPGDSERLEQSLTTQERQ